MTSPAHTDGTAKPIGALPPADFGAQRHDSIESAISAWLDWQVLAGVSDCLEDPDHSMASVAPTATVLPSSVSTVPASTAEAIEEARRLAAAATDLDHLSRLLQGFDGCGLKATAANLCYAVGNQAARLIVIGDAPNADDDRNGRPFSGAAGLLLERMLAAIGLSLGDVWATNLVFWRPPGNRQLYPAEIAVCRPFLERQIELLEPDLMLVLGGPAARALLGKREGESRLRGRAYRFCGEAGGFDLPARVTFHPAALLNEPLKKHLAWRDLQEVERLLDDLPGPIQKKSSRPERPLPRLLHHPQPEGDPTLS